MKKQSMDYFLGLGFFVHPLPALAVVLLYLNDHVWKWRYASWWTGKLSDFAGLFFFPLFLCALVCLILNLVSPRFYWIGPRLLSIALFLTGLGFMLIKLSPVVNGWYEGIYALAGVEAQAVRDPTDLIALIMLPLTYVFARRFWSEETTAP